MGCKFKLLLISQDVSWKKPSPASNLIGNYVTTQFTNGLIISNQKVHFVNAYVIMPNHLHVLIDFGKSAKSINTIASNGKRIYGLYNRTAGVQMSAE